MNTHLFEITSSHVVVAGTLGCTEVKVDNYSSLLSQLNITNNHHQASVGSCGFLLPFPSPSPPLLPAYTGLGHRTERDTGPGPGQHLG